VLDTDATELYVNLYSDAYTDKADTANISVRINSVVTRMFATANAVNQTKTMLLSAGQKEIEIITGQTLGVDRHGTYLNWIAVNNASNLNLLPVTARNEHICHLGGSSFNGYGATDPSTLGFVGLLRTDYPEKYWSIEGAGAVSLNEYNTADSGGISTMARLSAKGITKIVCGWALNDFGQNILLADFLNLCRTWIGEAKKYWTADKIYLQSTYHSHVAVNDNGELLSDWRIAQEALATELGVPFINGLLLYSESNRIPGESHPNNAGHREWATNIAPQLNLI